MSVWDDPLQVVSVRGRCWSRREVGSLCRRYVRRLWDGTPDLERRVALVDEVLADEVWCRFRRGTVPAAFAREVEEEVGHRMVSSDRA